MQPNGADQRAKSSAHDFARAMVPFWQEAVGAELLGVYLIGSLAHGGFSARYSDVDVAITTEAGLSAAILERARREAVALSEEWGPRLSVFWADRDLRIGRFPPLDRSDFLDHAVELMERQRIAPPRPTLSEVRAYLRGSPYAGWLEQARRFVAAQALAPGDRKAYLRALLYPARFCFSWLTGRMASNDEAVAFIRDKAPGGLDLDLISCALRCRMVGADPDSLFASRASLTMQINTCDALVRAGA